MTAAAGIEIGTSATAALGIGKAPGVAPGILAAGSATSIYTPSTASAGQDFRSGWQSLLTALGPVTDSAAELANDTISSSIPVSGPSARAGCASRTTSTLVAGTASRGEQGLKGTAGDKWLTSAQAELSALAERMAAKTTQTALKFSPEFAKTEEKKAASKPANESSATEALPGTLSPANATLPQIDSTLAVPSQFSLSLKGTMLPVQPTFTQANLPVASAADFTAASAPAPLSNHRATGGLMEAADRAARQVTEPVGSPVKQKQPLTAPGVSGPSGEVLHAAEFPGVQKDASQGRMPLVEGGEPANRAGADQISAQLPTPHQSHAAADQQIPNAAHELIDAPDAAQSILPTQVSTSAIAVNSVKQLAPSEPVLVANQAPAVATNSNSTSTAAPIQSKAESTDSGQQLTAPSAATPNVSRGFAVNNHPASTVAANSHSASAVSPDQSTASAAAPSQNKAESTNSGQKLTAPSAATLNTSRGFAVNNHPASLVAANAHSASTVSPDQSTASTAAPSQNMVERANPDQPLTVPSAATPNMSRGFTENRNPAPVVSSDLKTTPAIGPNQSEYLPIDLGQSNLLRSAVNASAAPGFAENGLQNQQSLVDSKSTFLPISESNAVAVIPLSQSSAPEVKPLQNLSQNFDSEFTGRQSFVRNGSPTEALAFASKPSVGAVPQFNPSSMISPGQSTTAAVEPSQIAVLAMDSAQGASQTATEISKPAQSFATNPDQGGSSEFHSNPAPVVVTNLNPASKVPSIQDTVPTLASSQNAVQEVDAKQNALPVEIKSSIAAQSIAVREDQGLPPASRSDSIQTVIPDTPTLPAAEFRQSEPQKAAATPSEAPAEAATVNTAQSAAVDQHPSEASAGEPSQFKTQTLATEPKVTRTAESEQQSLQADVQAPDASLGVAITRNPKELTASLSNTESSVEVSQSTTPIRTETPETILPAAKSPVPVRLAAHSELIPEQAANQASPQLNPIQPLAVPPAPVQTVAPVKDASLTTASIRSANTLLPELPSRDASPAATGTDAISPMAAVANTVASVVGDDSTQLLKTNKPASSNLGKSAVSGATRTERRANSSNAVQSGGLIAPAGSSGMVAEASVVMRELAGLQGSGTAAHEAVSKPIATVESNSAETFAALDSQGAPGRPAWIHAGAQQAEAGFQDPALGWVGVRADSSGSGIHAELVAGSADAAQALSGHMAGLNAFLAEHHTPVETLTLSTASGSSMESASDRGAGGGMQQGTGEQAGQQAAQSAGLDMASNLTSSHARLSEADLPKPVWPVDSDDSAQRAQWVGGHISVMA